jgi:hypothetical protein
MNWCIKQCCRGLSKCRKCLLIPFIPLALYLVMASFWTDRYAVRQLLVLGPDTPVTDSSDPAVVRPLRDLLNRPALLLEDDFALMQLYKYLYKSVPEATAEDSLASMKAYVRRTMSLKAPEAGRIEIGYLGADPETGESLVGFFADQLLKKAAEGQSRSGNPPSAPPARIGALESHGQRAVWRPERLAPASAIFGLSLLIVLAFIIAYEWADPSFKSERQIARYMNLPVFGSIPSLDPLSKVLRKANDR